MSGGQILLSFWPWVSNSDLKFWHASLEFVPKLEQERPVLLSESVGNRCLQERTQSSPQLNVGMSQLEQRLGKSVETAVAGENVQVE